MNFFSGRIFSFEEEQVVFRGDERVTLTYGNLVIENKLIPIVANSDFSNILGIAEAFKDEEGITAIMALRDPDRYLKYSVTISVNAQADGVNKLRCINLIDLKDEDNDTILSLLDKSVVDFS